MDSEKNLNYELIYNAIWVLINLYSMNSDTHKLS